MQALLPQPLSHGKISCQRSFQLDLWDGNAWADSQVTFTTKHGLRMVPAMGKKKQTSRQVSVRLPNDIADRLDKTADMLSIKYRNG